MNELIPILLIAVICLVIGFLLGLMVAGLRAEKGNSKPPEAESIRTSGQEAASDLQGAVVQPLPVAFPDQAPRRTSSLPVHSEVERSSPNPASLLARKLQPDVQSKPAALKSIAVQVDEILQEKLVSCSLDQIPVEWRAIRLIELPGKDLVVMVGLDQYEGVEMVPDPGIRSLIREAVEEWEKRTLT